MDLSNHNLHLFLQLTWQIISLIVNQRILTTLFMDFIFYVRKLGHLSRYVHVQTSTLIHIEYSTEAVMLALGWKKASDRSLHITTVKYIIRFLCKAKCKLQIIRIHT